MSKLKNGSKLPKKCRDRNQCFSWLNGKRVYHGKWGSPEANRNYNRFIHDLTKETDTLVETSKSPPHAPEARYSSPQNGDIGGTLVDVYLISKAIKIMENFLRCITVMPG